MAAPSRTISSPKPSDTGVVLTNPTIPGFSYGGGGGGSSTETSSFQGIDNPEAVALLMKTLGQLSTGGTPEMKRQQAERNTQITSARGTLTDYTKASAFQDAADLMAQNLRVAMEKNMPAINKAVENAGVSGSSMQALLSQKLATEASQASGALGAEQAKAYGGISAQLQGVLELLTRVDNSSLEALLKGLDLTRVQRSSTTSQTAPMNPRIEVGQGGGGSFYQPVTSSEAPAASSSTSTVPAATQGYWSYYGGTGHAADQPVGTDSFGVGPVSALKATVPNPYEQILSNLYESNQQLY